MCKKVPIEVWFPPINLYSFRKTMLIALDFDETYTLDPAFWRQFIDLAKRFGHTVICCTSRLRENRDEVEEELRGIVKIYYAAHRPKKKYLEELFVFPDVWIDDKPKHIYKHHPD